MKGGGICWIIIKDKSKHLYIGTNKYICRERLCFSKKKCRGEKSKHLYIVNNKYIIWRKTKVFLGICLFETETFIYREEQIL